MNPHFVQALFHQAISSEYVDGFRRARELFKDAIRYGCPEAIPYLRKNTSPALGS
eukprot:CAMPEP_0114972318 /NCGR_PEP_ID=MMETSP0216-20121206/328_1 /TAXON_ID=223996 /ORGANISM="Protocruzia adherens, Strain Boccale" /LENGTH=54 /DNA_ID=CAMNT_0002332677 /DNA_START=399 /DNA_END=563 /DNA_ORIENTATION=+